MEDDFDPSTAVPADQTSAQDQGLSDTFKMVAPRTTEAIQGVDDFDPSSAIPQQDYFAKEATRHLQEYQSGDYGELSAKEIYLQNLAAQEGKPFVQRFAEKLTGGNIVKAGKEVGSAIVNTFTDFLTQQAQQSTEVADKIKKGDIAGLWDNYKKVLQTTKNMTGAAAGGIVKLAPAVTDLGGAFSQATLGTAIGLVSPETEQKFDAAVNTGSDVIRHGIESGVKTIQKGAGVEPEAPESKIAENLGQFAVPLGIGEASAAGIEKLSGKIYEGIDKVGAKVTEKAGKALSATAPMTSEIASRAPEAAIGAALGAGYGHAGVGALIGAFIRPSGLKLAIESALEAKGDEIAQAARAIIDSPYGTAPIDAVQSGLRGKLSQIEEGMAFGKSKLPPDELQALEKATQNPEMTPHLSGPAKKVLEQSQQANAVADKINLIEKNKAFALFQKQVGQMVIAKGLQTGEAGTIMGGLAGASSPPGDKESVAHGIATGLGVGLIGSGISLPREIRSAVREHNSVNLQNLGKNNLKPDHPLYAQHNEDLSAQPEPVQNYVNKNAGIAEGNGEKVVALTGENLVKALAEHEGIKVNPDRPPSGLYSERNKTAYINLDNVHEGPVPHEITHALVRASGLLSPDHPYGAALNELVHNSTPEITKDLHKAMDEYQDLYNKNLAPGEKPYVMDYEDLKSEITADLGSDIFRKHGAEGLYGGKSILQNLESKLRAFLPQGDVKTGVFNFPVTGKLNDLLTDELFKAGERSKEASKVAQEAPVSPASASEPEKGVKVAPEAPRGPKPTKKKGLQNIGKPKLPKEVDMAAKNALDIAKAKGEIGSNPTDEELNTFMEDFHKKHNLDQHQEVLNVLGSLQKTKGQGPKFDVDYKIANGEERTLTGAQFGVAPEAPSGKTQVRTNPLDFRLYHDEIVGSNGKPRNYTSVKADKITKITQDGKPLFEKPSETKLMPSVDKARSIFEDYVRKSGIGRIPNSTQSEVDVDRAKRIASDFEALPKSSPQAKKSYQKFAEEIDAQYQHAIDSGMKFEFTSDDPYKSSAEMMEDVKNNNRLRVYNGGEDHPFLGESTKDDTGLTANEKFRAVHDLVHAAGGFQFGPKGEDSAWRYHAATFSDEARPAMTAETRGQNSWVNYGPHMFDESGYRGDKSHPNYIPPKNRPFAEQKASLLPEEHSQLMPSGEHRVNIGLETDDGKGITPEQAIERLKSSGVDVTQTSVHTSPTGEKTLVASLSRPLTSGEAHSVSEDLNQQSIAQYSNGKGELHGPKAEDWRPFQNKFFIDHEGSPLPENAPEGLSKEIIPDYFEKGEKYDSLWVFPNPDGTYRTFALKDGGRILDKRSLDSYELSQWIGKSEANEAIRQINENIKNGAIPGENGKLGGMSFPAGEFGGFKASAIDVSSEVLGPKRLQLKDRLMPSEDTGKYEGKTTKEERLKIEAKRLGLTHIGEEGGHVTLFDPVTKTPLTVKDAKPGDIQAKLKRLRLEHLGGDQMAMMPSGDPRAVDKPAIRMPDGQIFTGPFHAAATGKAEMAAARERDPAKRLAMLKALAHQEYEDGWTTNTPGEFLNRKDAETRAIELKQLDRPANNSTEAGGLDSNAMDDFKFMPSNHPDAIKTAAIKSDGKIYTGLYHGEIEQKIPNYNWRKSEYGWLNNKDEFLGRKDALKSARKAGQDVINDDDNTGLHTGDINDFKFMPSNHPDAIEKAAIKMPDGKVFSGTWHASAQDAALMYATEKLHGKNKQQYYDWINNEKELDGFTDKKGKFLTREEAADRARSINQIPSDYKGSLESFDFKHHRQFMPSGDIKEAAIRLDDGTIISKNVPSHSMLKIPQGYKGDIARGWIKKNGDFVTNEQAYPIALAQGQIDKDKYKSKLDAIAGGPSKDKLEGQAFFATRKDFPKLMPSSHPDAITEAAVRDSEGNVFTGRIHAEALDNAIESGIHDEYHPFEYGFVDNHGNFWNNEQAKQIASDIGQISNPEYSQHHKDLLDEPPSPHLDSIVFDRSRKFMPSTDHWSDLYHNLTPEERDSVRDSDANKVLSIFRTLEPKKGKQLALLGKDMKTWYQDSAETISHVFGPDADRFTAFLAALSPRVSVEQNLRSALNTWANWLDAGRPTDRQSIQDIIHNSVVNDDAAIMSTHVNNAVRSLSAEDPSPNGMKLSGPKVNSFFQNLRNNLHEITQDGWMYKYGGMKGSGFFNRNRGTGQIQTKGFDYLAMNAHVRQVAKLLTEETGETWAPAEVQAAIWSQIKSQAEGGAVQDVVSFEKLFKKDNLSPKDLRAVAHSIDIHEEISANKQQRTQAHPF